MGKHKRNSILSSILFIFIIIALISGCSLFSSKTISSENSKITDDGYKEENSSETSIEAIINEPSTTEISPFKSEEKPFEESKNRIMYFNSEKDFAFVYPQDRVNLMSNPFLRNESGFLKLSVEVFPENNNYFKENYNFSYKPSRKDYKIFETDISEYMILSAYSDCEVLFERTVLFNREGSDIKVTLAADRDEMINSQPEYFVYDEKACGDESKIWGEDKQDEFYEKLLSGEANDLAMNWYREFDLVLKLLQINEFKGASAGYDRVIDNRIFENDENDTYIINAFYPEFMPAASENLTGTLNKYIYKDTVLGAINDFKKEASNATSELKYLLNTDYNIVMFNEEFINLSLEINTFLGGAHGMYYFKTFNFDLKENKLLTLSDIFLPGFESLLYLSDYCFVDLKKQISEMGMEPDEEWIRKGTDPTILENFANFLITSEGLVIKILPYQAAPGAAGDFSVKIEYEKLKSFIKPFY